jgi:colicin import membrane protein
MLPFLLKHQGYPPAVMLAVFMHASLFWFMVERDFAPDNTLKIETVSMPVATVKDNPQKLRRLENITRQNEARQEREREQKLAREQEARRKADEQKKMEAEQENKAEQARKESAKAEEARQARIREQENRAKQQAANDERRREQALQKAEEDRKALEMQANNNRQVDNELVGQYMAIIRQLIQQNWVIPPSARNGMAALVEIRTTPIGDITSYSILQSSGDTLFDSSVLQAVARVGDLQELRDLPNAIYERNFRRFNLLFKPEDLLR